MRNRVVGILVLIWTILPIWNRASSGEEQPGATSTPKFDFSEAAAKYAIE